jgi:hypothetical protein
MSFLIYVVKEANAALVLDIVANKLYLSRGVEKGGGVLISHPDVTRLMVPKEVESRPLHPPPDLQTPAGATFCSNRRRRPTHSRTDAICQDVKKYSGFQANRTIEAQKAEKNVCAAGSNQATNTTTVLFQGGYRKPNEPTAKHLYHPVL